MASSYEPRLERRYEGVEGMEEILLSVDVRGGWEREREAYVPYFNTVSVGIQRIHT